MSRSPRLRPLAAILAALVAVPALALAFTLPAIAASKEITSAGPLTRIIITDQLNCQVKHASDSSFEFYPPSDTVGDCGTFVTVGGTLFGPDTLSAGGSASPRTAFTVVSQSAVQGSGTVSDPFRIVTVVDLGTTGVRVTETDSYVVGQETYRTDIQITNRGNAPSGGILYRAGDCYLQNSDFGFGSVNTAAGAVACRAAQDPNADPPVPGNRIEEWFPLTPASNYYEADFDQVWAKIGSRTAFGNTCRCNEYIDNGAGLSWNYLLVAGASATFSHLTNFSPQGNLTLATTKTADSASTPAGGVNGYTIRVTNPNTSAVTLTSISDTLPAGFTYRTGTSTGATTSNPTIAGQTLTWSGSFTVPAGGSLTLHFNVNVSTTPGTYLNSAQAAAGGGFTVAPSGPTAPIVVTAAAATPTGTATTAPTQTPATAAPTQAPTPAPTPVRTPTSTAKPAQLPSTATAAELMNSLALIAAVAALVSSLYLYGRRARRR